MPKVEGTALVKENKYGSYLEVHNDRLKFPMSLYPGKDFPGVLPEPGTEFEGVFYFEQPKERGSRYLVSINDEPAEPREEDPFTRDAQRGGGGPPGSMTPPTSAQSERPTPSLVSQQTGVKTAREFESKDIARIADALERLVVYAEQLLDQPTNGRGGASQGDAAAPAVGPHGWAVDKEAS